MSTQSAMLALLSLSSRRSAANRDELVSVSASAYAFHNDEEEVDDGNNHQHQMIPMFMMRSQSHTLLARLLEKRRALEAEGNDADVGVLSSRNDTSSPDNSTTVPTTPTYSSSSASYNASSPVIPEPTSGADAVDVAVSSGSSSYGVTMGSMLSEELVDKCLEKCPDSKLCTCIRALETIHHMNVMLIRSHFVRTLRACLRTRLHLWKCTFALLKSALLQLTASKRCLHPPMEIIPVVASMMAHLMNR